MSQISRVPSLWLSPFGANTECLHEIVGWLNDPEVVKYSENRHKRHTLESQRAYILGMNAENVYYGMFVGKVLIGTITAYLDTNNAVANIGIMIGHKDYWGKGHGFTAWERMSNYLFNTKQIRKLEAGCMSTNVGMMAICQKAGMVEEGRQERHFKIGDETADLVHWGKFNETI